MKKFYLLPAAALALMLGACSSDDVVPTTEGTGPQWNADGKGYVSLAINLPQEKSTMNRAANDQFEDGEPSEYDVKNAILVIFAGDNEASATFSGAYDLDISSMSMEGSATDQITSTVQLTQAINAVHGAEDLYALVVLNTGSLFTVGSEDNSLTVTTSSGQETLSNTTTFSDFQDLTMSMENGNVSNIASSTNGFLMMNAPLASALGVNWTSESGTVSTLAPLNGKVYGTEGEAAANPAAQIYVERAVAKVEVTAEADGGQGTLDDNTTAWTITGWALNNTNTKSYFVRNANTSDSWWGYKATGLSSGNADYRFIGTSEVKAGAGYRTYWAEDPNYNSDDDLYSPWYTANQTSLNALGNVQYCLENTFDVANQNQDRTTTVIVAAKIGGFSGDGTFFTLHGVSTTLYGRDAVDTNVKTAFLDDPAVKAALNTALKEGETLGTEDISAVAYNETGAGRWTVQSITFGEGVAAKFDGGTIPDDFKAGGQYYIAGIENANGLNIECYENGIAYYPVLIKHFGDDLTPWNQAEVFEDGASYPEPNAEKNWLGRYGVLRNNWYKINVTGISKLGSPTITEVTGSDDPLNSYISVQINVLSWAVRTQNVDL